MFDSVKKKRQEKENKKKKKNEPVFDEWSWCEMTISTYVAKKVCNLSTEVHVYNL